MAGRVKVVVSAVVLVSAFAGLLWSTLREGAEYYKHVDEVMVSPQKWNGKKLQLHGFVVPGSIMLRPDTLEYRFKLQSQGSTMSASYIGIVPDTFKDEAEVVLSGVLTGQEFKVTRNGVMAKCPSKYETK